MCNSIKSGLPWRTPCISVKGLDRRQLILILDLILVKRNINHMTEFVFIAENVQSKTEQKQIKSIKYFYSVYLAHLFIRHIFHE